MGRFGDGWSECDQCGDLDGDDVMGSVPGVGVLCWKCARNLGYFNPRSPLNRVLIWFGSRVMMIRHWKGGRV